MKPLGSPIAIDLAVNGTVLLSEDVRGLGEVRVQRRLSLPAQCELVFVDALGTKGALPVIVGDEIMVTVRGRSEPLFAGDITALHHTYEAMRGRVLRVRAYDRLHRLRKRQPVREHVQVSVADLARELVGDLGLEVEAEDPGPLWQRLIQHRQNDLELLAELAERCGLYLELRGGVLQLISLRGVGESLPLKLGETLLEAAVEVNADPACRTVEAVGWDPHRVERHQGRAEQSRVGRAVAASADPDVFGGDGAVSLMGAVVQDDRQAEALAQAVLDRRAAHSVRLTGVAEGDPALRPGAKVEVGGLDPEHSGTYVLTAVTHLIDAQRGFTSRIDTAPPQPQPRPSGSVAALGVVTRIDDPEKLGRVQVSLPTYGELETGWLGVLAAGAGRAKGLMALPDVGDQVLVLFVDGDPAQGVVVGGLYGVDGPPDSGIDAGAVRRYTILTPGGQRLQLDDHGALVRLENHRGSFVELAPDHVRLHAEGAKLTVEAPGQAVAIRGASIDFEKA